MSIADPGTRTPRAERTRTVIADALLSLLEEGDLQPTATRIAERAGISLRLIYHHFGDLEALFREVAAREGTRMMHEVRPVPVELPFDERVEAFVRGRCHLLEFMTPVRRAALLHEPFSPTLREARDFGTAAGAEDVERTFGPELAAFPGGASAEVRDALSSVASWNMWDELRSRGRSEEQSRRTVELMIRALLAPVTGS